MDGNHPTRVRRPARRRDAHHPDLHERLQQLVAKDPGLAQAVDELFAELEPAETLSRAERAKRRKYPIEALLLDDVVALLNECRPKGRNGLTYDISAARLRIAIVLMYRTGMRVSEMLDLTESDLNDDGTILIRHGKGDKMRLVGMDAWGWQELEQWLEIRRTLPPGLLVPQVKRPRAGQRWAASDLRRQMRRAGADAGLRKRPHPHALRHGWTVENHREGVDLLTLQAQLGHTDLTVTQIYLAALTQLEKLAPVIRRTAPMIVLPHS